MNIDQLKTSTADRLKFNLKNATVYTGNGFTYSKYLAKHTEIGKLEDPSAIDALHTYLRTQLQSNRARFQNHVNLLKRYRKPGTRVLDIGCGGGSFLSLARDAGYAVLGVELNPNRAEYCRTVIGLETEETDVNTPAFHSRYAQSFDCITLWDVIEHVNFPVATLESVHKCLAPGGYLLLDTPAKDSFYHRFGEISYALSRGRFPTFLNIMYSESPFGHKQIFSTGEMRRILEEAGYEIVHLEKIHELSFPYEFYLKRVFRWSVAVKILEPVVRVAFRITKLRNKMVIAARKGGGPA